MSLLDPCLIRSRGPSGEPVVRLGVPLVDDYPEFLAGRCRPNTALAAAYDLKVFFGAVGEAPDQVRAGDVLGFITSQRTGSRGAEVVQAVGADGEPAGVATSTVARRLSTISAPGRGVGAGLRHPGPVRPHRAGAGARADLAGLRAGR